MGAPALKLDALVARLDELPTLPTIVYELTKVMNNPMSSTNDVERIMANDISLTSRVLRLANSAYYAIPGGVSSLSRAIGYLGFDTVNQLVLSSSILKALEVKGPQRFDTNEFWKHSVGAAVSSEIVARHVGHSTPADMFTAGLVHDMGKIALCALEPELLLEIAGAAQEAGCTMNEIEEKRGYPSHTELGFALAKKWNLPAFLLPGIRFHHAKEHKQRGGLTAEANRNVDIIFLANLLTHALKFGNSGHNRVAGIPRDLMERLGLNPDEDLKTLLLEIKEGFKRADEFIRMLGNET